MSGFEPDAPGAPDTGGSGAGDARERRRRPLWQRVLIGILIAIAGLVVLALALFTFGGMGGSEYDPEIRAAYRELVETRQVAPVERRFVIPIPGCTCHSTDPYLTEQHRNRRLSECMGCHGG